VIYVSAALGIIAILAVLFAARCYLELWRWARQCQRAQIAIAYKNKVRLSAPLVEWLLWVNQLNQTESHGRTVYQMGQTRVAILKGKTPPNKVRHALRLGTFRRNRTETPSVREGTWTGRPDKRPNTIVHK